MEDPDVTIVSQYATAPTIISLVHSMNDWKDPRPNLDAFYDLIWNVDTAIGHGLDVWGRIVGVGRVLQAASGVYLGFAEAADPTSETPFNQAPFYSGQPTTGNYALTDDGFRTLIFAKALSNITDGSIRQVNQILMTLFPGRGNCYVIDNQNMSMVYHFNFVLAPFEAAIVLASGVMPKPAGIILTVVQVP
jgi:Protein of unknown function (DUF2612)